MVNPLEVSAKLCLWDAGGERGALPCSVVSAELFHKIGNFHYIEGPLYSASNKEVKDEGGATTCRCADGSDTAEECGTSRRLAPPTDGKRSAPGGQRRR